MDQFETLVKLNILPLGSYDILIGMDWLEQHRVVLNCYDKTFTCMNNDEKSISVKEIPRKTTIRQISALQLKRAVRKGCKGNMSMSPTLQICVVGSFVSCSMLKD